MDLVYREEVIFGSPLPLVCNAIGSFNRMTRTMLSVPMKFMNSHSTFLCPFGHEILSGYYCDQLGSLLSSSPTFLGRSTIGPRQGEKRGKLL